MLQVKGLTKIYGTNKVLDNVNLDFESSKIYGVLGRNGAGKTTLVNIMTNRAFATSGSIEVGGVCSYENDKVQENIFCITEKSTYPAIEKVSALFKWASRFYPNFDIEYAYELSRRFDLETEKKLGKLSTGYTTIAKVIITLASNTQYMLFDEPVLGIDAVYREVFYEELKKVHNKLKNCVILCSHILDEAETVIDDVIILRKGKIAFNGTIGEITKKQSLQSFYLEMHRNDDQLQTPRIQNEMVEAKPRAGKIDLRKIKNSSRYLFNITWLHALIVLVLCVLFTIMPMVLDVDLGTEVMMLINLFILAMTVHGYYFNYALYNGVSRRTYFVSIVSVLLGYAIFFSLIASIAITIQHFSSDMAIMVKGLYSALFAGFGFGSFITLFMWLLSVCVFLMTLALFSMVLYQALSRKGRYIAMIILICIVFGVLLWEVLASYSLLNILLYILGLKYNLGAWFAVAWFIILSIIFSLPSWLILKRTEIK